MTRRQKAMGYFQGDPYQQGTGYFKGDPHQLGSGYFKGEPYQWGNGKHMQIGGGRVFPPYRNIQDGDGFGDFISSIFRHILPILAPIANGRQVSLLQTCQMVFIQACRLGKPLSAALPQLLMKHLMPPLEQ